MATKAALAGCGSLVGFGATFALMFGCTEEENVAVVFFLACKCLWPCWGWMDGLSVLALAFALG